MRSIIKKIIIPVLMLFAGFSFISKSHAIDRMVSVMEDSYVEGTLRVIIQDACDDAGDDKIIFSKTISDKIELVLIDSLVIPEDCQGAITIEGSPTKDTILDGRNLSSGGIEAGDNCSLVVYSAGNTFNNLTFTGNNLGAGICLFGRSNQVSQSRFGKTQNGIKAPNRYGIVVSDVFEVQFEEMDGKSSTLFNNKIGPSDRNGVYVHAKEILIDKNEITSNGASGLFIRSHDSLITSNIITNNGGCPQIILPSDLGECLDGYIGVYEGVGIHVRSQSKNITIGGDNLEESGNIIQHNYGGGVFVIGHITKKIQITHNIISRNYGEGLNIDLRANGHNKNDQLDTDKGANTLLNHVEHLQAFPLVDAPNGSERYWAWGASLFGTHIELYEVADDDSSRNILYGGGDFWVKDINLVDGTFEIEPENLIADTMLTTLNFTDHNNTSEYSLNIHVAPDSDMDGIIDDLELGGLNSSHFEKMDTDNDGLPDASEDKNRNGQFDDDESYTYSADSDEDGLDDFQEIHGDGFYDKQTDTNPLLQDTDGDGLKDGIEDANHNGIWETHLQETSPILVDSDGDGYDDAHDVCEVVYNPGQEIWLCNQ